MKKKPVHFGFKFRLPKTVGILTFLLFMTTLVSFGQTQRTIQGTVVNANDDIPLLGVSIIVKGTTIGAVTDFDGKYSIQASPSDVLQFSYVGFQNIDIPVLEQSTIDVSLEEDFTQLNEVTITSIGYGTVERREITSAVASVDSKEFNKGNISNPAQLLQGKVAGLSIAKPGGDPNAGYNIRLRGLSTFGANSQPLIVIDGVVGGALALIDPNDIKSIEVLKDASAAAIYGTRGASGVILVTTKKAVGVGAARIEYNTYLAMESVAKFVPNSTPEQFVEAGGVDNGYKTDWLDLLTQTGISNVHNLAISNGTANGNYRASINYRDVEGIALGTGFDQLNARFNFEQRAMNDKLILTLNGGVTKKNAQFKPYESLRFAIIADPTAPVYIGGDAANGYWEPSTPEYHNPLGIANEVTDEGTFKTMLGNIRAKYKLTDNFDFSAFYSLQYESDLRSQYFSSKTRFSAGSGQKGRARKESEDRLNELFELTANYQKNFNGLKVSLLGGYSWQQFSFENFNAFNTNFITDELLYNALELGLGTATGSDAFAGMNSQKEESRLISFFGRAMFNFEDKFFVSGSIRREGSSKFGINEQWGNFYSISGGMDFAEMFEIPFSVLKLRAGYGITGNLPNENYESRTRLSRGSRSYFNNTRYLQGVNFASNPNPDLKWEEKAETNMGLDFGLFDSRLYGSIDFYSRNTTDVLQSVSVPVPPNFYPNTLLNIGELKSNGLEIALNGAVIQKQDFSYNTGVTFSTFNTELVSLDGDREQIFLGNLGAPGLNNILVIRVKEGEKIGDIMAPTFEGLDDQGRRIITDRNGDGTINQEDDAVVAGNGLPDFEIGWSNSFHYRNLDLNFTMRGAFGHSLVNINRAYYESPAASNNYNPVRTKYYLPELTQPESWNSYYVEKADFLKLDNITLGYNFEVGKSSAIKSFRLYASGQNLFVISGYTGVDPEVHYSYGSPLAPGVDDRNSYFRTKTISLGLNIGL
ncbi:SusC/RagA family TonB-linked outer membrane protein [Arenibacter sp. M-2]|uniref:SusC/RagA family TonB-linked outer membrane protein n=1 Tax=Arenibacter sp. M-2 TaxID=3053612 RepID=UPI002570B85B|nr:SusC/RagA family TonB-linked outer membrane protein [Arenibacter sp. M-2]MDL5514318.1 SusC/RagA family TonB-linked outer membrane protein [Arenibacter sp. M-2]